MALEKLQLDNGLTVYNDRIPGALTNDVSVFVPFGSVNEQPGDEGVAHVFEHCVHLKTDKYASKAEMARHAEHEGMVRNANTYYTRTLYYANGMGIEPNIDFLSQILQHTHFPEDAVEHELKAVRREMTTNLDNVGGLHGVSFDHAMFGTPYGRRVGGYHDKIDFDVDTLKALHRRYYQLGNMALVVSGNAKMDEIARLASDYFVADTDALVPAEEPPVPILGTVHETGYVREDSHNVRLSVGYPMSPEYRDEFNANRLAHGMAFRAMSHSCFERMRYDEGLSYDGSVFPLTYNHPSAWSVSGMVTVDKENIGQARAIFDEIFTKQGADYTREQLEGSLATYKYAYAKNYLSIDDRSDQIISRLQSYREPEDIRKSMRKLTKLQIGDVRQAIDKIVAHVAVTPGYTHKTGTRDAIGDVERIVEQSEIA